MKCPRCDQQMVCYVSSPAGWQVNERRFYFSCRCGMIAARSGEQGLDDALVTDESAPNATERW